MARSRILALAATVAGAALLTGCVSMQSSGPVLPYRATQENADIGQQYLQLTSAPPGQGWDPLQIAQGFLAANASFGGNHQVAREYLTSAAASSWSPGWSATVFKSAPLVQLVSGGGRGRTARVELSGDVQAVMTASGSYEGPTGAQGQSVTLTLERPPGGEWRISNPRSQLLLSAADFSADYQSRNLYFFDPTRSHLVADPVYVPLEAARADPTTLLSGLVRDLIPPQQSDWLGFPATQTAFPQGSKLLNLNLTDGTVSVDLGGSMTTASTAVLQQVSAQLLWTLIGSGDAPAVQSVEVFQNGKAWIPANGGPVQQELQYPQFQPATGSYGHFYYIDPTGDVRRRLSPSGASARVYKWARGKPRLSVIAVSPDEHYLAGLSGGSVFVGPLGGPLTRRLSGGYTSLSWDSNDQLWAVEASGGVELVHASGGTPIQISIPLANPVTALRVAPDGVRVALVIGGSQLRFGAIQLVPSGRTQKAGIVFSPFFVTGTRISGLSWYGADNVITWSSGNLTEYPVNGGTPTSITAPAGMVNVTASWAYPLIASLANSDISYDMSIGGGSWVSLGVTGKAPVYPG